MTDFTVVIPARTGSERLPGKPLAQLAGKAMIQHVQDLGWASGAQAVIVATDDQRVADTARAHGGEAVITSSEHDTGTDRISEVAVQLGFSDEAIIVNLQGDEPLIPSALLRTVADGLSRHTDADVATLAVPMDARERADPDQVKVVCDHAGYALYFSRATIPWPRGGASDETGDAWRRHLGVYAYRAGFLRHFPGLRVPCMESLERLEQLRALWHGYRVHVAEVATRPEPGVDTQDDLERVAARLRGND